MTRPFLIGLTGSIGMGKTTTAGFFADEGIPTWSADDAVHRLYSVGGAAVGPVGALFPEAVVNGAVDRARLIDLVSSDKDALSALERVVHPLVAEDRAAFVKSAVADIVVLDIPLLFENNAEREVDFIVTVTAPPDIQRERVMQRPGMTEPLFTRILSRQLADADKQRRADRVIETREIDTARGDVKTLIAEIRKERHA